MSRKENIFYNTEGYSDPTAYNTLKKEEYEEKKLNKLIYSLKRTIELNGFELLNRIELKDKKSGRIFK